MSELIQPADLGFFSVLASAGSLSAAGRELGVTTPAVSKHLAQIETRLGVLLINRTTRRMSLTPEGELYLAHARRILGQIDDMAELLGVSQTTPSGLLRVNATLGFGRTHIAPIISRFARANPKVEVQLQLSVNPPPLTDDSYDVCIRFGAPPAARPARPRRSDQDPWHPEHQRRRDRGQLGAGWPWHPDAGRVGHRSLPEKRPPGAGAAGLRHAGRRHPRGVPPAPSIGQPGEGLCRVPETVLGPVSPLRLNAQPACVFW